MADTAMSDAEVGPNAPGGDTPPDVTRLRGRGCWTEAALLLAPYAERSPAAATRRAALLIECCMFTLDGWAEAEDALRTAEALARTDDERGEAACERGNLAYLATLFGLRDRADEARAALMRSAALLAPGAAGRPLLDFRRGLVAENLGDDPAAARAAYRRAHAGAVAHDDVLLTSYTWRHLAGLAARDGDVAEARHGFTESLRIRVELGYAVGVAPALTALAGVTPDPEAGRLRAEAARLFRTLGGVPVWLAEELPGELAPDAG
ncbi:hypothetical protein ACFYWP_01980 [Actinacidiphila glaucinigra]|uniref:hypothetical protein n=1 Tax=Actinacidiphila glaucinigra TaxID=235986 RepID=UPI0036CE064C